MFGTVDPYAGPLYPATQVRRAFSWRIQGDPRSHRHRTRRPASADLDKTRPRLEVVDPDRPIVSTAARIKAGGGLSYADAFRITTTRRIEAPLWTGDPEIVARASAHSCDIVDLRV